MNPGHRIAFESMDWAQNGVGVRSKVYQNGSQRVRLVEFTKGFTEPGWCVKGHSCYVLEGGFSTDFNGAIERYGKGDVCIIPPGEKDKHKALLGRGERVLLILFEMEDE